MVLSPFSCHVVGASAYCQKCPRIGISQLLNCLQFVCHSQAMLLPKLNQEETEVP